ncbi:hypothetical protein DY000_02021799 [Brassica cretica]|uniref:Uncharacterized protein n=1 Tax=Brassica cretica TaxID=69181 RepID=A0ABQ7EC35_BRACR|nr:hypothetical protein DY000_02021799 [Brassica cretica]
MAGFTIEADKKIAAELAACSIRGEGNPGMDDRGQEVPVGGLTKGKRGRPRKSSKGLCDCDVLIQMVQKPHKVRDYLEEFLDTAKMCQPKPAEELCRLFKVGLREDIRAELVGVLEPLEFALVKRVAGQALHAEEWLAERAAEAEYDRFMEGDEDPEPSSENDGADGPGPETNCASPHQCG